MLRNPSSLLRLTIHECPNVLSPLHTNKPRPSLQKRLCANIDLPVRGENCPHTLIVNTVFQLSKLQPITCSSERRCVRASQKIHAIEPRQCRQCSRTPAMSSSTGAGPWEPYLSRWILRCRLCIQFVEDDMAVNYQNLACGNRHLLLHALHLSL